MRITRLPVVVAGLVAVAAMASPAAAQLSLGPLDDQGQGPVPPIYGQGLRQNLGRPTAPNENEQPYTLPPKGPPLWQVTPRVDLREEATDNVRDAQTGRQADLITTLTPGIYVAADAPRLVGNLDYSASFQKYAVASDQDNIDQNLFGTAIATVVPDAAALELRGTIFDTAHTGAFGAIPSSQLTSSNRTSTYAIEASPVLRHSFRDVGNGELRYIFGQTWFSGQTAATGQTGTGLAGVGTLAPITAATQNELRGTLDSADIGKYLSNTVTLDGQRTDVNGGTGSNKEGLATDEVQVHVTKSIALVGSGGWQTLQFAQVPSQNLSEPTWYGGFIYEPNSDARVSLNYGHRDGADSFLGDLRYALTPVTTAYANYSEITTTPQQAILQNLSGAVLGPNGTVLNATTGLPISLNNSEFSLQNDVERLRTFQASLVTDLDPNRFTVTGIHQEMNSLTGLVPNDAMNGVTATWNRRMTPLTNMSLSGGYFLQNSQHTHTFDTTLEFSHAFTPSLFGAIDYNFAYVDSVSGGPNFYRNSLILTLRKVF
ncbi:MAG: TIGR03016 family PEP-CTERM system-associated outer membrane protein [Alphaproteobacteria bacterium]|nr:TIGR03016 family PEP-CTERM system-associated outer membrane protein [Alphaproteobacteria bacterium]